MDNKKRTKRSFWSDGMSIDESRFSLTSFMAIVGFFYVIGMHYFKGVFEAQIPDIVTTLIVGIIGVNAVKYGADAFRNRRENNVPSDYNDYEEESYKAPLPPNDKF